MFSSASSQSKLAAVVRIRSEENENFPDVTFNVLHFFADYIESNGLGEGSALSNSDNITDFDTESWRTVSWDGVVAFLESVVLLDVMQVVASDNDRTGHLGWNDDTPSNGS